MANLHFTFFEIQNDEKSGLFSTFNFMLIWNVKKVEYFRSHDNMKKVSVLSGQPTFHFFKIQNDEKGGLFSTSQLYAN